MSINVMSQITLLVCFHFVRAAINHNCCSLMPKEWWWVNRFRSPGIDCSRKHSSKCLKPSKNEPASLRGDLVVHEGGKPSISCIIFLDPGAVEDAFEDDGRKDLPGGMCDRT